MKNYEIVSKCCYIASMGFNIAALINFIIGNSIIGSMCLCFGSAFLCFNSIILNKSKKNEEDPNEKE